MIGKTLGHYQITEKLGEGGMGLVYKAQDLHLDRFVALKILPPEKVADPERKRRFVQEAKSASALNHPNIIHVYDIDQSEGTDFIAMEYVDGKTLDELTPRKGLRLGDTLRYAAQIADALAAAHSAGIVHRDLKPANVMVTDKGLVKVLDFGLAKLTEPVESDEFMATETLQPHTEEGTIVGTVAYMSPEQAEGKKVDARSDIFSLGSVLYEMVTGQKAFQGTSKMSTLAAILHQEPKPVSAVMQVIPADLEKLINRCLRKDPARRIQHMDDVKLALDELKEDSEASKLAVSAPVRRGRRVAIGALAVVLLAGSYAGLFLWTRQAVKAPVPSLKRITLRRGRIYSARFTPDFQSVVYSAAWEGKPAELFVQRLASADARPLGVAGSFIGIAGTAGGDLAMQRGDGASITLAQLPLEGGTPRDLLKNIDAADWDRSGTRFAIVRLVNNGRQQLEYPAGKVLLETTGLEMIASPRISPDGARIAFVTMPNGTMDAAGDLCVVDVAGRKQTLSKGWLEIGTYGRTSLGWSRDGNEVWFSATRAGFRRELHAVTLSGKERIVARFPGSVVLQDIAPDGRLLVIFGQTRRWELRGRMAGDAAERDLSWLDGSFAPILAPDGTQMLFQEWGEGGTATASTYYRRMDGPTPTRLGDGGPCGVSPDWMTALVLAGSGDKTDLKLVPIGAGETRTLPRGSIRAYYWALWHPDGKRILIVGSDAEGQMRLFVQALAGGPPRPFARLEGALHPWIPFSADGRFVAAWPKEGPWVLYPIGGGETRPIPFLKADELPLVFSDDGRSLFVTDDLGQIPLHVMRLDLKTGKREPWLELAPPDRSGAAGTLGPWLTPNGRFYTYNYSRELSDLYLVEELK